MDAVNRSVETEPHSPTIVAKLRHTVDSSRRALRLVWNEQPVLVGLMTSLTVLLGLIPTATAYTGGRLVDAVSNAVHSRTAADAHHSASTALVWVTVEASLLIAMAITQRVQTYLVESLRDRFSEDLRCSVFERALELDVAQHESPEFQNNLTQAMNNVGVPCSTVSNVLRLAQGLISLVGIVVLLAQWSVW